MRILTVDGFEPLMQAFAMFGPQGEDIASRYRTVGKKGKYYGLGASWDPGRWFVMGEWAHLKSDSLFGSKRGAYVSGGLRLGVFTPYASWADVDVKSARSDPGLDLSLLPAPVIAVAAGLNAALNGILASNGEYSTLACGERWDFAPNLTLKLQHERIDVAPGSWGPFTNVQPGFQSGGAANVFSAAVSFVL